MKKHLLALTFALFSFSCLAQWNFVGIAGISCGWSVGNKLETDTLGMPVVVFYENILNKAACLRFNGTQWVSVGNPSLDNFPIESIIDFIIDKHNNYYLLFTNTSYELSCIKYDGKIWKYVGTPKIVTKQSVHATIAIDSNSAAYVVHPTWGAGVIIVKENSGSWIPVPTINLPTAIAYPTLKFDSNDIAYLGYTGGGFYANCSKLVNGVWKSVGETDILGKPYTATNTKLHITKSNEIYIAFDGASISCYKLDAITDKWKKIGSSGLGSDHNWIEDLTSDSNSKVYITTSHIGGDKAMCFTFTGTDWVMLGNSPISESYASYPTISTNKNGKIFVAYNDFNLSKAVVKEYSLSTSTSSLGQNDQFKLFPNPSNGHFFIELPGKKFTITIYDINGILIAEYPDIFEKKKIDSKLFRKGIYVVNTQTSDQQRHYKKLIIN